MARTTSHQAETQMGSAEASAAPAGDGAAFRNRRASVGRRLAAFVLDTYLLAVLLFVSAAVVSAATGPAVQFLTAAATGVQDVAFSGRAIRFTTIAGTALGCAYFLVSWAVLHATPGQRFFGLEVRARDDGGVLTPTRALVRWIALGAPLWIAAATVPGWIGVGAGAGLSLWFFCLLLTTAFSATGQGLHDRLSGTRVVAAQLRSQTASGENRNVR